MLIRFPIKPRRHGRASAGSRFSSAINRSSVMSENAVCSSGQALRGMEFRCFHALTTPGGKPSTDATAAGPPFSSMSEAAESAMPEALPIVTLSRKCKITPCNVTVSNVLWMADEADQSWRDLQGAHQRLRWARKRWQTAGGAVNGGAVHAAASLGMKPGTYRAYERAPESSKHTKLESQEAIRFARKFKVSWIWLLTGEGTPFQLTPEQARVINAMMNLSDDQQKMVADMVEGLTAVPHRRTGTKG